MRRHSTDRPQKFKRCKRYNEPGHAHHLTFSCFHRQAFLGKDRCRRWFLESLAAARSANRFDLWAYVIMPEHCHLLLWPRLPNYSISHILWAIKVPVATKAKQWLTANAPDALHLMRDEQPSGKVAHRFWQRGGGYDGNVVDLSAVHAMIEYIHANPVRRGLVERMEDWPWSSASFYAGGDALLRMDTSSLPPHA